MPTTEIAVFPLKAGVDVGDPDNQGASVAKNTFDTLRTIDGMRQINFGPSIENPTNFQLMVGRYNRLCLQTVYSANNNLEWDDYKNHMDFMKSDTYGPFLERFMTLVDGEPSMMHAVGEV